MTEAEIRSRVVSRLQGWVGARRGDATHRYIIDTYNSHKPRPRGYKMSYTDDWCAATPSAVAVLENLTDIMPVECSCGEMMRAYQAMGRWVENDAYIPKPADLIFYTWGDDGVGDSTKAPNHVGTVEKVVGSTIIVIEGNKGANSVCGRREININGRYIRGYAIPDYASKAEKPVVPTPGTANITGDKPWYAEAKTWAKELGIADGTRPTDPCTRAEVWQMLKNYDRVSPEAQRGE